MHPALDLMHAHRSIRSYTDEPIPREHVLEAVRAGQMAATSSAVQAYCAIRVTDGATRAALARLAGSQEKVRLAPEFLVICGDTRRHRVLAARAGRAYDQRLEAFLVAVIDAALFAQNMVLAFEAMGYGTCYIGGLRNDLGEVDRLLGLPEGVYPLFGVCVGRPAEQPAARPRLPVGAVLFDDAYPDDEGLLAPLAEYDAAYREYLALRGAPVKGWSEMMGEKFERVTRGDVGEYYRSKGAELR